MIRKMLLTAAVFAVVIPAAAQAQATGQVSATAIVGDHIVLTGTGDMSFGTVLRTADAVVSAVDGSVTRVVTYNRDVAVAFTAPSALTGSSGSLPVTLYCAQQNGATWTGATNPCTSGPMDLNVGATTTQTTLGFGGRILQADIEAAIAGTYTGTIDIVVTAR
jgi:hypothetical protein